MDLIAGRVLKHLKLAGMRILVDDVSNLGLMMHQRPKIAGGDLKCMSGKQTCRARNGFVILVKETHTHHALMAYRRHFHCLPIAHDVHHRYNGGGGEIRVPYDVTCIKERLALLDVHINEMGGNERLFGRRQLVEQLATWLQDLGVDYEIRQTLLGHRMPGMTAQYSYGGPGWNRKLRAAVEMLEKDYDFGDQLLPINEGSCASASTS